MFNLIIHHNERDIEIPLLIEFLKKNDCFLVSVLDVGYRQNFYAPYVRDLVGCFLGIDIIPDLSLLPFYDELIHENFLFADLLKVDWVISVSTIEHIGVEYLPTKLYRELQLDAFAKMLGTAQRGLFITFPYGEDVFFAGHYYNGNRRLLDDYLKLAKGCKIKKIFLSTPDPKDPESWREISQELADKATQEMGNRVNTICVLEVYK